MNPVIKEITAERQRQISEEGWSSEHDDAHESGEMASAAACYALATVSGRRSIPTIIERIWPWDFAQWKPGNSRRSLIKAAALIVAEIERLDRKEARDDQDQ